MEMGHSWALGAHLATTLISLREKHIQLIALRTGSLQLCPLRRGRRRGREAPRASAFACLYTVCKRFLGFFAVRVQRSSEYTIGSYLHER